MKNCTDVQPVIGCFKPNDTSLVSVPILIHVVYDKEETAIGQVYTLASDNETPLDINTYLGGGIVQAGHCKNSQVDCVESQEWTYGIDNTGTIYSDVAEYEITLSDGSILKFSQDGSSTGWTQQLTEWSANIQTAADAAGLQWFVEPRAVNNPIPTDISGNYGSNPTGLPGAPSIPIAVGMINGGMAARYVNIQICPAQPVPVTAERIVSATYTNNPYNLTTAGAILGPIQKFSICRNCGEEPIWYLEDGVTLASAGQIPNCYEPCGTLSTLPAPPESDCTFEIDVACDNNNSINTVDFTNTITRRAKVCNGEQIGVDYFEADPTDASALISYSLIGDFVDCASGQPIEVPVPECSEFELTTLYRLEDSTTTTEGQLREREWLDTGATVDDPVTLQGSLDILASFGLEGNVPVPTAAPDTDTTGASVFLVNDTSNAAGIVDYGLLEGYVIVDKPFNVRYSGTSERYNAIYLGECCSEKRKIYEISVNQGGPATQGDTMGTIPAGIHSISILNLDSNGSNASANFQVSFDGGVTWLNESNAPWRYFSEKPSEECIEVKVCEDTGAIIGLLNGIVYLEEDLYSCSKICKPSSAAALADLLEKADYQIRSYCDDTTKTIHEQLIKIVNDVETNVGLAVDTEIDCSDCELIEYYELEGNIGATVSRWMDAPDAVSVVGGNSALALEAFTAIAPDGLPAHVNTPTSTTIETDFDVTTTLVGATTQTQIQGWVYFPTSGYIRDNDGTGETSTVYIDNQFISNQPYNPFRWNDGNGYAISAGFHKIDVYIHDNDGTNSGFDLEFSQDDVAYSNVVSYIIKPTWVCKKGYLCDGQYLELDKVTPVVFSDTLSLCKAESSEVDSSDLKTETLCDSSKGIKVEVVCCKDVVPTRWGRTYNSDYGPLGIDGITVAGLDDIMSTLGCTPNTNRTLYFQGAVYVDGIAYSYSTTGINIPATQDQGKLNLLAAMNQAVAGTGTSFRLVSGFIEMRGRDVDLAYSVQKGYLNDTNTICWDNEFFIYRDDVDGVIQGDAITSPVPNPYDPLALGTLQNGSVGTI